MRERTTYVIGNVQGIRIQSSIRYFLPLFSCPIATLHVRVYHRPNKITHKHCMYALQKNSFTRSQRLSVSCIYIQVHTCQFAFVQSGFFWFFFPLFLSPNTFFLLAPLSLSFLFSVHVHSLYPFTFLYSSGLSSFSQYVVFHPTLTFSYSISLSLSPLYSLLSFSYTPLFLASLFADNNLFRS